MTFFLATPTRSGPTCLGSCQPTPAPVRRASPRNALPSSGSCPLSTMAAKYRVAEMLLAHFGAELKVESLKSKERGGINTPTRSGQAPFTETETAKPRGYFVRGAAG